MGYTDAQFTSQSKEIAYNAGTNDLDLSRGQERRLVRKVNDEEESYEAESDSDCAVDNEDYHENISARS